MRNVILDYYHSVLGELRKFVLHVLNIILYKTRKVNLLWNSCMEFLFLFARFPSNAVDGVRLVCYYMRAGFIEASPRI